MGKFTRLEAFKIVFQLLHIVYWKTEITAKVFRNDLGSDLLGFDVLIKIKPSGIESLRNTTPLRLMAFSETSIPNSIQLLPVLGNKGVFGKKTGSVGSRRGRLRN